MELADREAELAKERGLVKTRATPVVCVNNDGYPASLELGKIYPMLPPEPNEADLDLDIVRVVDESGESYLFSSDRFRAVELSEEDRDAIFAALHTPIPPSDEGLADIQKYRQRWLWIVSVALGGVAFIWLWRVSRRDLLPA